MTDIKNKVDDDREAFDEEKREIRAQIEAGVYDYGQDDYDSDECYEPSAEWKEDDECEDCDNPKCPKKEEVPLNIRDQKQLVTVYSEWCETRRKELQIKNPSLNSADLNKILFAEWEVMSGENRQKLNRLSQTLSKNNLEQFGKSI